MKVLSLNVILAFCFSLNALNGQEEIMNTRIIDALKRQDCALAEEMLSGATDLNYMDNAGGTMLMYSAINGCFDVANWLLEKGANASLRISNGKSASDVAANEEIRVLLDNSGKNL
jgi:ankyrin repeat protein